MSNELVVIKKNQNNYEMGFSPDTLVSYSMKSFEKVEAFRNYINSLRIAEDDKISVVEHENAHYTQAIKEGFKPRFILWERTYKNGKTLYAASTEFIVSEKENDRLIRIISAPKCMSPSDKLKLEELLNSS